jgi:hypothetical protein
MVLYVANIDTLVKRSIGQMINSLLVLPLNHSPISSLLLHNRERRIEHEVDRVAELQGGKSGNTATGEEGGGVTGSLAVVTVQSIDSVKVAQATHRVCSLHTTLAPVKCPSVAPSIIISIVLKLESALIPSFCL